MPNTPILLPAPHTLKITHGICNLLNKKLIKLDSDSPQSHLFSARRLKAALAQYCMLDFEIYAGKLVQSDQVGITLRLDSQLNLKSQEYRLTIFAEQILIEAGSDTGIFYACCTLIQLFQVYTFNSETNSIIQAGCIPCMEIVDRPDFPHRGVMLDISRDKVPTMETMYSLVDLLASWKINQLQLYTEHTFAYQQHPLVWDGASPFTGEEILVLDAFCRERYVELVPCQNSFGHLEHWLRLPQYRPLAEAPKGFDFPWGRQEGPFSLCPLDPGSITLLNSLYDELLPHFSSRQFNVGFDETFDIGQGRSKAECERLGVGRVYLDFLHKVHREVTQRGYQMQFWGDIIITHPDLVKELPRDMVVLEWGYEGNHPFKEHAEQLAQAGLSFYVCPGTSSWNSIAGRTDNCLANLSSAAQNGFTNGADGYMITDWGDNGHWQVLPISYLGFAAGAAYAWSYLSNKDLDLRSVLNLYVFKDPSGRIGDFAFDLGNLYRDLGVHADNGSNLFYTLQNSVNHWGKYLEPGITSNTFHNILDRIIAASRDLSTNDCLRTDKDLLQREYSMTLDLLRHACMRGMFGFGSLDYSKHFLMNDLDKIIAEYQLVWLSRNRPGGLSDSLSYFEKTKIDYLD